MLVLLRAMLYSPGCREMQREQNKQSHSPTGLILNQNEETGLQRSWCVRDSGTEAPLIPPLLASLLPFRASLFSYLIGRSQAKRLWIPTGLKLASHFITGKMAQRARGQACPRTQGELGLARRGLCQLTATPARAARSFSQCHSAPVRLFAPSLPPHHAGSGPCHGLFSEAVLE